MKSRMPLLKPAFGLLPKGQHQLAFLAQEGKAPSLLAGLPDGRKSKNLLVELLGSIQVAHIQTDVTCLEAYCLIRTHVVKSPFLVLTIKYLSLTVIFPVR